jgi:hypothetical protein
MAQRGRILRWYDADGLIACCEKDFVREIEREVKRKVISGPPSDHVFQGPDVTASGQIPEETTLPQCYLAAALQASIVLERRTSNFKGLTNRRSLSPYEEIWYSQDMDNLSSLKSCSKFTIAYLISFHSQPLIFV